MELFSLSALDALALAVIMLSVTSISHSRRLTSLSKRLEATSSPKTPRAPTPTSGKMRELG